MAAGFATALALATAGCSGSSTAPSAAPTSTVGPTTTPGPTVSPPTGKRTTPSPSAPPSSAPATEFNPPGDIPDNQVFVDYSVPGSRVHIQVPEGWARSTSGGQVTFSDHFNSIGIQVQPMSAQPTVATVRHTEVPALAQSIMKFALTGVSTVQRQHGSAVRTTYQQDSRPDPVTGRWSAMPSNASTSGTTVKRPSSR